MTIKHLGTNGGGFFGANSAHPFENPNAWTDFLEIVSFMVFPFALVFTYGVMLKRMRHALVIYGVMLSMMLVMLGCAVYFDSLQPNPAFTGQLAASYNKADPKKAIDLPEVVALPVDQSDTGNLEGKELRFGRSAGATFATMTTAISCGSVNCMHDSLNPMAGLSPFTGMWLNCVFGGKGVGVVNMLVYIIVAVFIAGLMVGRTPEYLGKKIEAREMKLAMIALLIHPIVIVLPAGIYAAFPQTTQSENTPAAHGFSEILYQFSSCAANNGSGFEGLGRRLGLQQAGAQPVAARARQPVLRHRHRHHPAAGPAHPGGGAAGARRRPDPEEADAAHRRHPANRHADVRPVPAGDDLAGGRAAVHAGGHARAGGGTLRAVPVRELSPRTGGGAGAGADATPREGRPRPRIAATATEGGRGLARPPHGAGVAAQGCGRPGRPGGRTIVCKRKTCTSSSPLTGSATSAKRSSATTSTSGATATRCG